MPPVFLFFPTTTQPQLTAKSIDLNGTNESLRNTTNNALGIANTWSISLWGKIGDLTSARHSIDFDSSLNNDSGILIEVRGDIANDPLRVAIRNTAGTIFKFYTWDSLFTVDEWFNLTLTWDGTNLTLYFNGSSQAPTSTPTDNAGTMDDEARRVFWGVTSGGANYWQGLFFSLAVWNSELSSAEASAIYNAGNGAAFDLRNDSGDYVSSANLQHYWIPGFNESDIGGDLGNASTLIDVAANAENITAADDLVEDVPSG